MDKRRPQWVGAPAGQHGPNTFYKGCKFFKNGKWRILSMGEFFFLKTSETEPLCIAELQLLWQDDKAESGGLMLSSSKFYFLPENTPEGRTIHHGENEVVGVSGKAIVRLDDLIDWVCTDVRWTRGCRTICEKDIKNEEQVNAGSQQVALFAQNSGLDNKEVNKKKQIMGYDDDDGREKIIILNYPNYCRYCAALKRIERVQDAWVSNILVRTLGAFTVPHRNTRIMFCKDEFDHPTLGFNEKLCDHLAPNMKGRPRKKKLSIRSSSNEDLVDDASNEATEHNEAKYTDLSIHHLSKLERKKLRGKYRTKIINGKVKTEVKRVRPKDEATFLAGLFKFMKDRNSPIDRVPNLGFKQIDLFLLYTMGQKFGGYEAITARRLWKKLYDVLGGSVGSTSAATCTRRHYERLILPYERFLNKHDYQPLPSHPSKTSPGISILAKPVKSKGHTEKDSSKHHKKDKHYRSEKIKDRPKGMTKAEETWIRDKQKAVAAGLKTILTPGPTLQTTSREQPRTTYKVVPSASLVPSMVPSMAPSTSAVPSLPLVTSIQAPPSAKEVLTPPNQHQVPFSNELVVIPSVDSASSSLLLPLPSLKMKLKVKKSRHKDRKRPKVLKDQLRELQEQQAIQQNKANNQLYANSLQLSPPPVVRKKARSIADIINHQAKMQAKQRSIQAASTETAVPGATTTMGNPGHPQPSTSALSIPYPVQPIMVKTEEGMHMGPLFITLPQMLPGSTPVTTSTPGAMKTEEGALTAGLKSTTAPSLARTSNMATVVHVGQPLQVMQMHTPSLALRDSAVSGSMQYVSNTSGMDSVYTMTSVTNACLSYPYNMAIPSSTPISLTAVVNPMTAPPQSPSQGSAPISSAESTSARPSVIQHTQHIQAQTPDHVMTSPPYRNAVQPSDLILRNLSHEKAAAAAAAGAAVTTSAPVVGQKLSDLPKDAVVVTPRMVSPYMAYIPMPVMPSSSKSLQSSEEPKAEMSKDSGSKRRRTESGKENISRPLSPHRFSVDRMGKVTPLPFAHPTGSAPGPIQDEPCDLSMPKQKCSENEMPGIRKETSSHHSKHKSSSRKHGEASKDRTRWHEELGAKHHIEDIQPSSSLPFLHRVKMTPNPRGSIMQGVINPSALSPSACSKSSDHRDTPSRQSTSSNEAAPSPFPYLPHPGMQGVPSDKQPKNQFVFPEFNPHLSAMMGYPPRLFPPQFMPGPLITRPDLLPTSLPPGMQLNPEQLMRREMFFPPHFPFPIRPPFLGSPPYMHQS